MIDFTYCDFKVKIEEITYVQSNKEGGVNSKR